MLAVIQVVLFSFWMVLVPVFAGNCFYRRKSALHPAEAWAAGYVFMFSAGEVLSLLAVYFKLPLHILVILCAAVFFLTALNGVRFFAERRAVKREKVPFCVQDNLFLIIAVIMIIAIAVYAAVFSCPDTDDAFFVGMAVTEQHTDTVFQINPIIGMPYKNLPSRYILSQFPTLLAVFAELSGGVHPAVIAHIGYPLVFIPFAFAVRYLLARYFFEDRPDLQGIFLAICAAAIWFSGYSVYNSELFLFTRVWHGKGLLAGAWLPLLIYYGIMSMAEMEKRMNPMLPAMAVLGGCSLSQMGIVLAPVVMGLFVLYGVIKNRKLILLVQGLISVLPALILGTVYLLIS